MENGNQRPYVGIGVVILKEGKILLGKRKNAAGEGEYACPGGNLEHMESIVACARRETAEETGIEIGNIRLLCLANVTAYGKKHYMSLMMAADWVAGEPRVMEPEKCEGWEWYDPERLPSPIFSTVPAAVEALQTGRIFFDA